jgi:hypothetical protein
MSGITIGFNLSSLQIAAKILQRPSPLSLNLRKSALTFLLSPGIEVAHRRATGLFFCNDIIEINAQNKNGPS